MINNNEIFCKHINSYIKFYNAMIKNADIVIKIFDDITGISDADKTLILRKELKQHLLELSDYLITKRFTINHADMCNIIQITTDKINKITDNATQINNKDKFAVIINENILEMLREVQRDIDADLKK